MMDEDALRWWLLGALLVPLPIVMYHRVKAHRYGDRLDRRQEGLFILFTLRPVAFVFLVSFGLYVWNPASMAWSTIAFPAWMRWSGVGLIVVDGVLLWWTLHSLGANLTDTVVTRKVHTLVITGPYRWVRHPFYDAVALLLVAISLAAANWFMLAIAITVVALLALRTSREEHILARRFGNDYRTYMARTNRFLPRRRTRDA
jgi:protein-S-isoprenylcysteine O-methyltransferase Ste14